MQVSDNNQPHFSDPMELENYLRSRYDFAAIVGHDPRLIELLDLVVKIKDADLPVLIEGESGTGKELFARALHFNSKRKDFPLLNVDCGAIPENLMESEFFGYEKGAFTGAANRKTGKFEAAGRGTIFLDEIDALSLHLQAKLLRAIQWGEFTPVGGVHPKRTEARIIAATNGNLKQSVENGQFRQDLFYRLNVLRLELPPLCERRPDIPVLCEHFLKLHGPKLGFSGIQMSGNALRMLANYGFPGNIRELENLIMRAILLASGGAIQSHHLPVEIQHQDLNALSSEDIWNWPFAKAKDKVVSDFEKQYIIHKLRTHQGVVLRAARSAGMYEANFRRKLKKYRLASAKDDDRRAATSTQAQKLEYTSKKT
jgi:transcriptional regulator with PAS, ATPase and Fis domain